MLVVDGSRSWRAQFSRDACSLARMKSFDCNKLTDDSLSLTEMMAARSNSERAAHSSVQSRSYDVMYCTAKPRHGEGRLLQCYASVFIAFVRGNMLSADIVYI